MPIVYLGFGSNLGDRAAHLEQARDAIAALPGVHHVRMSPVYETDPVGGPPDQPRYLNAAAEVHTDLPPVTLLAKLLEIELRFGREPRDRREHCGPRVLDVDLLLYDDQVIDGPGLTVPHPRMHRRAFVLQPLADLAPGVTHPVLGRTVIQLLDQGKHELAAGQ